MKFILEPSVYVVIKPAVNHKEVTAFLSDHSFSGGVFDDMHLVPQGELPVVIGGRNCYQSFSTGREHTAYIKNILEQGHGSVLEHSNYGILITGVSRSLTHELIRHRQFGVSQLSQRFVEHNNCNFVVPPALIPHFGSPVYGEENTYNSFAYIFIKDCEFTVQKYSFWLAKYQEMKLSNKEAKEAARSKLTNDVETRILITGDLRCWRVFFELRCDPGADKEIRRLAWLCYKRLREECPNVFADYVEWPSEDGKTGYLKTDNNKV